MNFVGLRREGSSRTFSFAITEIEISQTETEIRSGRIAARLTQHEEVRTCRGGVAGMQRFKDHAGGQRRKEERI